MYGLCVVVLLGAMGGSTAFAHAGVRWLHGEDNAPLWVGQGRPLANAFRKGTSPVLSKNTTFVRLGMRWDGPAYLYFQARFSRDGKSWTSWRTMIRYWSEGTTHNSHIDPPASLTKYAQIRIVGEGVPTFLAAELIPALGPMASKPSNGKQNGLKVIPPSWEGQTSSQTSGLTGPYNDRSKWNAAAAKCTTKDATKQGIAIHHTVTPNNDTVAPATRVKGIQSYHQNSRGWCDIGYHILISEDGQAWEGRPAEVLGSHVGSNNKGTLGISFMGTFDAVTPNKKMLCKGAELIAWAIQTFGIQRNRTSIMGHREFPQNSTTCPGNALFAQLGYLVQQSASTQCNGVTPPPTSCDFIEIVGLSGGQLNIREGTSTNFKIVGTVTDGICLKVLGKQTGQDVRGNSTWYKISYNGVTGWVSGYYAQCSECGKSQDTTPPKIVILAPKDGTTTGNPTIEVQGNVTDNGKIASVTVNGQAVTLNSGGVFTTQVTLQPGPQSITVNATDEAGNKGTASVQVIYQKGGEGTTGTETTTERPKPTEPATEPNTKAEPPVSSEPVTPTPDASVGTESASRTDILILTDIGKQACQNNQECPSAQTCYQGQCVAGPGGGCGCNGTGQGGNWGLFLLMLGLLWMRKSRGVGTKEA
jgi:MYXO-CTERM domain-containing protein